MSEIQRSGVENPSEKSLWARSMETLRKANEKSEALKKQIYKEAEKTGEEPEEVGIRWTNERNANTRQEMAKIYSEKNNLVDQDGKLQLPPRENWEGKPIKELQDAWSITEDQVGEIVSKFNDSKLEQGTEHDPK